MPISFTVTWAWGGTGLGLVCFAFAIYLGIEMFREYREKRGIQRSRGLRDTLLWEGALGLFTLGLLAATFLLWVSRS